MDYLELLQRWKVEAGVPGTAPVSIAGNANNIARAVNWIQDTWNEIQLMPRNWKWMRFTTAKDVTVAGGMDYDPVTDWAIARFDRMRQPQEYGEYSVTAYLDAAPQSEWEVRFMEYEKFRRHFLVGTPAGGPPQWWSEAPDGKVLVGPPPDQTYKLHFDYFNSPQVMTADADEPEMPAKFHLMVMWGALNKHASRLAAPEMLARSFDEYGKLETLLIHEQAEQITVPIVPIG